MSAPAFVEVAREVYVLRYPVLDVNVTLVVGEGEALLVDSLSTDAQARELAAAARRVTPAPWIVVNTHHHFDHCFGNAALRAAAGPGRVAIWGHEETAALLSTRAEPLRRHWYAQWAPGHPELAAGLAAVEVVPPDHLVRHVAELSLGGRTVRLRHPGRGHTAGDLVVEVPDADVLVAGDLVEQGAPPSFEDSYPLEWAETLATLGHLAGELTAVVPGHGAVVDSGFLAAQHRQLTEAAWLIRDGLADGAPPERLAEAVATRTGWPVPTALTAAGRGYAELSGRS